MRREFRLAPRRSRFPHVPLRISPRGAPPSSITSFCCATTWRRRVAALCVSGLCLAWPPSALLSAHRLPLLLPMSKRRPILRKRRLLCPTVSADYRVSRRHAGRGRHRIGRTVRASFGRASSGGGRTVRRSGRRRPESRRRISHRRVPSMSAWGIYRALDRDIAIDARLPDGGEVDLSWQNMKGYGSASTFQKTGDKKVSQSLRTIAQFEPNSHATLVVHYAPEPWQTSCEFKIWYTRRGKRVRTGIGPSGAGRTSDVILVRPTEENGTTTVVAVFDLDDVEHRDVRIIGRRQGGSHSAGQVFEPASAQPNLIC